MRGALPWVVASGAAGVLLGWLLGTGALSPGPAGDPAPRAPPPPPIADAPPPPPAPPVARSVPAPPRPAPAPPATAPPATVPPGVGTPGRDVDDAPEPRALPAGSDPWEEIPLDSAMGESLGSLETRRAFSRAMRQPTALGHCMEGWIAPAGVVQVYIRTELRVRSEEDALVVEDAHVLESNVSDGYLERCLVGSFRGRRVPAPGVRPDQAFRIQWGSEVSLR